MEQTTPPSGPPQPPTKKRRYLRRLLVLAVLVLTVYLFRGPLLRGLGRFFVVEAPPGPPGFVVVLGPGFELQEAARLCRDEGADGVLLFTDQPDLARKLRVVWPNELVSRLVLGRLGVGAAKIQVLPVEVESDWDRARQLGAWLRDHPDSQVTLLCMRFQGRRWQYLLHDVLSAPDVRRVRVVALPRAGYDETNWWHDKEGQLDFFAAAVGYTYLRLGGEGSTRKSWDPDQYERSLRPTAP